MYLCIWIINRTNKLFKRKYWRSTIKRIFNIVRFYFTLVFFRFLEFLLGENILVAPVIVENAKFRDIYLPAGLWRDENNPVSPLITGRVWLYNYSAEIEILPWFTKVGEAPKTSDSITLVSPTVYILATAVCVYLFWWILRDIFSIINKNLF